MTSAVEQGRRLEAQVAAFFGRNGYEARCNQVLEGRSGGRHEVDVLAEKSDLLTTFRVAIECKAWQTPIEKDVVAKLHHVMTDLGLSKGIVVSLAGCRSGAEQAAADLGIELWGPDELRRHLGDAAVGALTVPAAAVNQTHGWGLVPTVPLDQATVTIQNAGKGRFGLRTLEQVIWASPVWVPVYSMRLSVAQPEVKRLRTRLRETSVVNLYEALSGSYLAPVRHSAWQQVEMDHRTKLKPVVRDTKVQAALRKAVEAYSKVTSAAAVERHTANLASLGVPTPCNSLSFDGCELVHLPYYAGILQGPTGQRVVAVTGWSGAVSDAVSQTLTSNITQLRSQFSSR